jgi:hypothetical protein
LCTLSRQAAKAKTGLVHFEVWHQVSSVEGSRKNFKHCPLCQQSPAFYNDTKCKSFKLDSFNSQNE